MGSSNQWFFALDGERAGPVDIQTLAGMIQSGRLPDDVLVCREGMSNWMPANDLGLIKDDDAKNHSHDPMPSPGTPHKMAYVMAVAMILILSTSFGYIAIQSKKHDKHVTELNSQMDGLKNTQLSLSNNSTRVSAELENLKKEANRLRNNELGKNLVLADLNASKNDLASKNKKLAEQFNNATNQLAQIIKAGSDSDEKVRLADQRASKAEENVKSIQAQMDEIIKKSQLQAAEFQKQVNQKEEVRKEQINRLEEEKNAVIKDLKFAQTNLTAATKKIYELKKELGNSPPRIGAPNGPKPPVKINFFAKIGSTDTKFNFAVINKGSGDGVKVGDTFRVESKESGETICQLKISRVQPMVAVGSPGTLNVERLTPGDLVYRE